jgi:hypothetical protein
VCAPSDRTCPRSSGLVGKEELCESSHHTPHTEGRGTEERSTEEEGVASKEHAQGCSETTSAHGAGQAPHSKGRKRARPQAQLEFYLVMLPASKKARVSSCTSTSLLLDELEKATLAVTAREPSSFSPQELKRIEDAAFSLVRCQRVGKHARQRELSKRHTTQVLLPPEVLELVFGFLKTKDMARACQTCRYFQETMVRAALSRVRDLGLTLRRRPWSRDESPSGMLQLLARLENDVRTAQIHIAHLDKQESRTALEGCHEAVIHLHGDALCGFVEAILAKEAKPPRDDFSVDTSDSEDEDDAISDLLHLLVSPAFDASWYSQRASTFFTCLQHNDERVRLTVLAIIRHLPTVLLTDNVTAFQGVLTDRSSFAVQHQSRILLSLLEKLPTAALAPLQGELEAWLEVVINEIHDHNVRMAARSLRYQLGRSATPTG